MPQFPRKETDVIVLADAMIAGYTAKGFSMGGENVQPH